MKAQIRSSQLGFTMIEALVALLVMSFGMLGIAGFQTNLSLSSDVAKQRTEATRLAQEKMEELRSFGSLADYAASMVTGTETITGITTNTSYTRTWGISSAATPDTGRSILVTVSWTGRADNSEQVQLYSYISATDPSLNGGLFFPLPDGTILRRPKNRSIDIPIPAISITGTGKSYIPWSGDSPGYLVFSDDSGDIVQKCTAVPTADNLDTDICATFDGYLLSGYITGTSSQVALVTRIVVPFGSQQYVNGNPECAVDVARDQTTGSAIANTKSYVCLIQPTNHDGNIATPRVWSGRVDLAGATGTSLAGTQTCRFSSDANTTVNDNHPAVYSLVDRSLDNQNFYISTGSCANASLSRVLHLNNTGLTYSVTYDVNSGTGSVPVDASPYGAGSTVMVLTSPEPTKTSYNFIGWSLTANGPTVTSFSMPSSNTTLYAQWSTSSVYKVTYDLNGGVGSVPSDASAYLSGSTVTVLSNPVPTKTNFTFGGWSLSANGTVVSSFTMPASNVTLYAQWNDGYKVTYDANGGTGAVPEDTAAYTSGSSVAVKGSPVPTRSGYAFGGWSLTTTGTQVTSFTIATSNVTLYAKWSPVKWSTPSPTWSGGTDPQTLSWSSVDGASFKLYWCKATDAKVCSDFTETLSSTPSVTPPAMKDKDAYCYKVVVTGPPNSDSDASVRKCVIRAANGKYSYQ